MKFRDWTNVAIIVGTFIAIIALCYIGYRILLCYGVSMKLQDWTNVAQIFATLIAGLALGYTGYQIKLSSKVNRAQFWLDLRKMFAEHKEVHQKLRPAGEWSKAGTGPTSLADWASIEAYMGLFEHCENMLADGLLDKHIFQSIYLYRLKNLIANKLIVEEKLNKETSMWKDFLSLLNRFDIHLPSSKD